jgi:glutamine phosphoribosylpyrophosphate amidotransferase
MGDMSEIWEAKCEAARERRLEFAGMTDAELIANLIAEEEECSEQAEAVVSRLQYKTTLSVMEREMIIDFLMP